MNKEDLRAPDYLGHLLQACDRIRDYTRGMDYESFAENQMVQDAVLRNIEILGEATKNLMECWPEIVSKHPEVSWIDIYGMRNRIIHAYLFVNPELVWNVIEIHIPVLRTQIQLILSSAEWPDSSAK
jgi:uncharacterized protein with HEPN domain